MIEYTRSILRAIHDHHSDLVECWSQQLVVFPGSNIPPLFDVATISGILKGSGRRIEILIVPRKTSRLTNSQKQFRSMIESAGGIYLIITSASDLREAMKGLR
jgi:hypothetical protein